MGGKSSKHKSEEPKKEIPIREDMISRSSFEFLGIIGRGGFGKVWKVYSRKYKRQYAMKEMSKAKIIDKKSEKSVKAERDLLAIMNHPFIINMHFSFQDNDNLYIAMDLLTGGDLRYHICSMKNKKFNEVQTKFFIACIILSLEYIHTNNILHRDLKPENLVLDDKGYVKLTDFGIAKIYQKENYRETSGTPGYMAPEVMCAQNHTIAVDYFALGVIGYEFMNGVRPYLGKNRKEIKEKMMSSFQKNGEIKTSSQQEACFNILKKEGYDVKLNFLIDGFALDILLEKDGQKIDIEYDGNYWHQDKNKDRRRDEVIKSKGFKIFRIKSDRSVPTIE